VCVRERVSICCKCVSARAAYCWQCADIYISETLIYISILRTHVYYIYTYVCVCVCVCIHMYIYAQAGPAAVKHALYSKRDRHQGVMDGDGIFQIHMRIYL